MATIVDDTPGARAAMLALSKFAEKHDPHIQRRNPAAKSLLEKVAAIANSAGLQATFSYDVNAQNGPREQYSLLVFLRRAGDVHVKIVSVGGNLMIVGDQQLSIPELEYNPVKEQFEGRNPTGGSVEDVETLAGVVVRELEKAWQGLKKA